MNSLGGLHGVAIGVMDDKSIKIFWLGPVTRVPTLPLYRGTRSDPRKISKFKFGFKVYHVTPRLKDILQEITNLQVKIVSP